MSESATTGGARILLDGVTKRYAAQAEPAVDNITMEIPAGEIVMLVGPSGCGKTTTMKMINRLIEPTSGRILIGDDDVTKRDPDQLRRHIGYVIQGAGLFPHLTVGDNIAIVPRLLKWDKKRIASRVDELLDLVSLDPSQYRDRYPRELSGGQQQRVGVARALAADPPVLLMDEPFGAVDPITRQRLQDELLRLQDELRKTIVFVTHDFDEAVKLGDRIAILQAGSKIVQYNSPERILAEPADDFVRGFVGAGAALKQLTLTRVRDVDLHEAAVARVGGDPTEAIRAARSLDREHVIVLDAQDRPQRWLSLTELEQPNSLERVARHEDLEVVNTASTLNDALDVMLTSSHGVVVVTGRRNSYQGVIRVETIMDAMSDIRGSEQPAGTPS
ncbi:betaine/proline/choline family ABC transporter ATP-binding protein [Mycolicibacterium sp. 120270]|uniref:betaine/proline/choline family ABC transporter ATP-binding protein n=1 Tax=Mycolicibacterium sp. 120270 TaxID=3090600 RepID=UPI00299EC4FD|nr:betaine/proline/choline family ABC transporter ATP-binding protein [Mycolicibacterium sp. 120270]MDX1883830.1 betaine/proline/choline family ABC transporter ATP-binding protein [Mycolicibacterium sp. 120270]